MPSTQQAQDSGPTDIEELIDANGVPVIDVNGVEVAGVGSPWPYETEDGFEYYWQDPNAPMSSRAVEFDGVVVVRTPWPAEVTGSLRTAGEPGAYAFTQIRSDPDPDRLRHHFEIAEPTTGVLELQASLPAQDGGPAPAARFAVTLTPEGCDRPSQSWFFDAFPITDPDGCVVPPSRVNWSGTTPDSHCSGFPTSVQITDNGFEFSYLIDPGSHADDVGDVDLLESPPADAEDLGFRYGRYEFRQVPFDREVLYLTAADVTIAAPLYRTTLGCA